MSGDETYLEAFVESLSTLPSEVRRSMELMKDLDQSAVTMLTELRVAHKEYVHAVETKLMELEVAPIVTDDKEEEEEDDEEEEETTRKKKDPPLGVRVLGTDEDKVVIPTTEELADYVRDPKRQKRLQELQLACLQLADEKVAIANQTHALVDAQVQRLDRDLEEMEKILQATGEFQASGTSAKPNDLAACQPTPGSEWILAKVIQHDPATGMYELADEDVESNKIFHLPDSQVIVLRPMDRLSKGDVVFCVYPDTTSFYQAKVVQVPRKAGPGSFVSVHFVDDSDEFGVTHDKAIPLNYVMPPPFGA